MKKNNVDLYYLGNNYPDVAFTRREAECMLQILNNKSLEEIANLKDLKIYTITFYLNNMMAKLDCKNISQLIEKVKNSDFLANIDFDK